MLCSPHPDTNSVVNKKNNNLHVRLIKPEVMYSKLICISLCILTITSYAQIQPTEGSKLNYRLVGFSVPYNDKVKSYTIEIAPGHFDKNAEFQSAITITETSDDNKRIITVPQFGSDYTWRMISTYKRDRKKYSPLYHFSTMYSPYTDTSKYRLKIIDTATSHKDMYVLLDFSPVIYNMRGEPIWFLPDIPNAIERGKRIRDLKATPFGTFTIMSDYGAFEFDYNGKLLWRAPNDGKVSGDTAENYHHEFTRLNNGNYITAGFEKTYRLVPSSFDTNLINKSDETFVKRDSKYYKRIDCGTIIMYDTAGNVIWSWHSSNYFSDDDYFGKVFGDGMYNTSTHLNGVYFDEPNNVIYASFRDLSRVIKISYPSGEVIRVYGKRSEKKTGRPYKTPFKAQHCPRINKDGNFYLFNNNTDRERDIVSQLCIFKEPADPNGALNKIWEFPCDIDTFALAGSASGGSVCMLDDSCILACMGIQGRVFLVNYNKQVLWNAIPEYKDEYGVWTIQPEYRASYIENPMELRRYIFKR